VTKVVLLVPTALLLGHIVKTNGFKFAFSVKGLAKGMFASLPIIFCVALSIVAFFFITEINRDALSAIPATIVQQTAISFYEEVLIRGLFITAILINIGDKAKGRIIAMLVSVVIFAIYHMANILTGSSVAEAISNTIMTIGPGIMLTAVYIYSKNLLSAMIMHTSYNLGLFLMSLSNHVNEAAWGILNVFFLLALFLIGPIFAIILIIKAKPFVDEDLQQQ
jgi:membrane protease YdiL (CAAX protease family)